MNRKQISIRVSSDLYKTIRVMLANEDKTLQDYLENMIIDDLKNKNIELKEKVLNEQR